MNIQEMNGTVIMEMTVTEARDLRDACYHAKQYWQYRAAESTSEEMKKIFRLIALECGSMRTTISDTVGY